MVGLGESRVMARVGDWAGRVEGLTSARVTVRARLDECEGPQHSTHRFRRSGTP